eukprot:COSAG05_NODE_2980_length_2439_cov_12.469658_2_plen_42_part_00
MATFDWVSGYCMPPRTQLVLVVKFRFPALHALLDLNKADMG